MATIILSRRVDRHRGLRAAGVDGKHDFRRILLLSELVSRSRPRVGWSSLLLMTMSKAAPKGLDDSSESTGFEIVECTTGFKVVLSSSGIR